MCTASSIRYKQYIYFVLFDGFMFVKLWKFALKYINKFLLYSDTDAQREKILDSLGRIERELSSLRCGYCGRRGYKTLHGCSGCGDTYYCSKHCQKRDWKYGLHKEQCHRKLEIPGISPCLKFKEFVSNIRFIEKADVIDNDGLFVPQIVDLVNDIMTSSVKKQKYQYHIAM